MVSHEDRVWIYPLPPTFQEDVAVEKEDGRNVAFEYVAVEQKIQKHPYQACSHSLRSPVCEAPSCLCAEDGSWRPPRHAAQASRAFPVDTPSDAPMRYAQPVGGFIT